MVANYVEECYNFIKQKVRLIKSKEISYGGNEVFLLIRVSRYLTRIKQLIIII